MTTFAGDLARGLAFVHKETGMEVVLVGHSSGGGLAQFCLDKGRVGGVGVGKVKGVVLAGSIPGFGRYVLPILPIFHSSLINFLRNIADIEAKIDLIQYHNHSLTNK